MHSFEALRVLRLRLQGVGLPKGVAQAELRAPSPTWGVKSGGGSPWGVPWDFRIPWQIDISQ